MAAPGADETTGSDPGPADSGTATRCARPALMATTPTRLSQIRPPRTTEALTRYVALGSITEGSNGIENAIGPGPGATSTRRFTTVPVSFLINVATATASEPSVAGSVLVIVPATAADAWAATGRTASMPVVGPPVRTAIPCGFCHDSGPSIMVANRPYACFGSIRLRSIGTENGSGTSPIPSIRC